MFKSKKGENKTGLFVVLGLVFIIGFSMLISNLTGTNTTGTNDVNQGSIEFKSVTYAEYEKLFGETNKGLVFVYVGRPACSYCQKIQPLLKQLETEESIVFNYLNTDNMSQEEFGKISSTSPAFAGEWGTPTLLAIIDGKEHSNVNGYREIAELRTFVKTAKSAAGNE